MHINPNVSVYYLLAQTPRKTTKRAMQSCIINTPSASQNDQTNILQRRLKHQRCRGSMPSTSRKGIQKHLRPTIPVPTQHLHATHLTLTPPTYDPQPHKFPCNTTTHVSTCCPPATDSSPASSSPSQRVHHSYPIPYPSPPTPCCPSRSICSMHGQRQSAPRRR